MHAHTETFCIQRRRGNGGEGEGGRERIQYGFNEKKIQRKITLGAKL